MKKTTSGFTIVELLVVIIIIGVLASISYVSFGRIQADTRDSQRSSQTTVIAEALEKYYGQNGEYPGCTAMAQDPNTVVSNTLKGTDPGVMTAPNAAIGTNSILPACADLTSGTSNYAYVGDGSNTCTTGQSCSQWTLKYREESTGNIISIGSRHNAPLIAPNPTIAVTLSGSNVLATITPTTCSVGTIEFSIRSRTNDSTTWSDYSAWSTDTTATQLANDGVKYGYQAQARCVSGTTQGVGSEGSEATYIDSIGTPSAPIVAVNTVSNTSTWSWAATSCPTSTTASYQYRYTISPSGYDSGWVATNNLSVALTTSTGGQTYTVAVQTNCSNIYTTSAWSGSGSASYFRPAIAILVVAGGGAGGNVSGAAGGGGGGSGGYYYNASYLISPGIYTVTVGTGGTTGGSGAQGNNGNNSIFSDITMTGGGGGGGSSIRTGKNGGSGGGGAGWPSGTSGGGTGIAGQGNNGGGGENSDSREGGGGGGQSGVGGNGAGDYGGDGGAGTTNSISGTSTTYAGGGGGSTTSQSRCGDNAYGGGTGNATTTGSAGTNGKGAGGGGGVNAGGTGGTGIVIIRYPTGSITATGGTVTTSGSDTIHTFTSSGTFTVL